MMKQKKLGSTRLSLLDIAPEGGIVELKLEGGNGTLVLYARTFDVMSMEILESKKIPETKQLAPFRLLLESDRYLPGNVFRGSLVFRADNAVPVHSLSVFLDIHFQSLDGASETTTSKYFTYQTWGATAPVVNIASQRGIDSSTSTNVYSTSSTHANGSSNQSSTTLLSAGIHIWPFEFTLRESDTKAFTRLRAPRIGCRFTASLSTDGPTGQLATESLVKWIDLCGNMESVYSCPPLFDPASKSGLAPNSPNSNASSSPSNSNAPANYKIDRYGKDFSMTPSTVASVEWAELPVKLLRPALWNPSQPAGPGDAQVSGPRSQSASPSSERPKLKQTTGSIPKDMTIGQLSQQKEPEKMSRARASSGSVPRDNTLLSRSTDCTSSTKSSKLKNSNNSVGGGGGKDAISHASYTSGTHQSSPRSNIALSEDDLHTFYLTQHQVILHDTDATKGWKDFSVDVVATQIYYPEAAYHSYTESRNYLTLKTIPLKPSDVPEHVTQAVSKCPASSRDSKSNRRSTILADSSSNGLNASSPSNTSAISAPVAIITVPPKTTMEDSSSAIRYASGSDSEADGGSRSGSLIHRGLNGKNNKRFSVITLGTEADEDDVTVNMAAYRFKDGYKSLVEHGAFSWEDASSPIARRAKGTNGDRKQKFSVPITNSTPTHLPFGDLVCIPPGRMPGAVEAYVHVEISAVDKNGARQVIDRQPIAFGLQDPSYLPVAVAAPAEMPPGVFRFGYLSNHQESNVSRTERIALMAKLLAPGMNSDTHARQEFSISMTIEGHREEENYSKIFVTTPLSLREFEKTPALVVRQHPGLPTYPIVNSRVVVEHITSAKTTTDIRA